MLCNNPRPYWAGGPRDLISADLIMKPLHLANSHARRAVSQLLGLHALASGAKQEACFVVTSIVLEEASPPVFEKGECLFRRGTCTSILYACMYVYLGINQTCHQIIELEGTSKVIYPLSIAGNLPGSSLAGAC